MIGDRNELEEERQQGDGGDERRTANGDAGRRPSFPPLPPASAFHPIILRPGPV